MLDWPGAFIITAQRSARAKRKRRPAGLKGRNQLLFLNPHGLHIHKLADTKLAQLTAVA